MEEIAKLNSDRFPPLPLDASDEEEENGRHVRKSRWVADEDLAQIRKGRNNEAKDFGNVSDFRSDVVGGGDFSDGRPVFDTGTAPASSGSNQPGRQTDSQYLSDGNLALAPDVEDRPDGQPAKVIPLRIVPKPIESPEPTIQPALVDFEIPYRERFEKQAWKRSRIKPGLLIQRIPGYDINELEYGVNYLKQLSGGKTSADGVKYPHAGFFTWRVLAQCARLAIEEEL